MTNTPCSLLCEGLTYSYINKWEEEYDAGCEIKKEITEKVERRLWRWGKVWDKIILEVLWEEKGLEINKNKLSLKMHALIKPNTVCANLAFCKQKIMKMRVIGHFQVGRPWLGGRKPFVELIWSSCTKSWGFHIAQAYVLCWLFYVYSVTFTYNFIHCMYHLHLRYSFLYSRAYWILWSISAPGPVVSVDHGQIPFSFANADFIRHSWH